MYKKILSTILVLFFTLFLNLFSFDENDFSYGQYFDYGYELIEADFRALPDVPSCCPQFSEGTGYSYNIGAFIAFKPDIKNIRFSLLSSYQKSQSELKKIESETFSVDMMPYNGEFEHFIKSDFSFVTLKPVVEYLLLGSLSINFGTKFLFPLTYHYSQKETIVNPADRGNFNETGTNVRNQSSGSIPNVNSIITLLSAGINYSLPLNKIGSITAMPEIGFDYALNGIIEDVLWKNHRIRFGLCIAFNSANAIPDKKSEDVPKEVIIEEPFSQEKSETKKEISEDTTDNFQDMFRLDVVGVEDSIEKPVIIIRSEEIQFFSLKPLLTYIFFDDNSSVILDRYNKLRREETDNFNIITLEKKPELEIYHQLLNIIGKRMQENRKSKITLTGCNNGNGFEKDNNELSKNRAEAIKKYLTEIWNIDTERIKIKARGLPEEPSNNKRQEGLEENRRVEIISDDWEIVKPIMINDTIYKFTPPILRFYIRSLIGSEDLFWKLKVNHRDIEIGKFIGNGIPQKQIDLKLKDAFREIKMNRDSIYYKLSIQNKSTGESAEYSGSFPVNLIAIADKGNKNKKNIRIEKFNLILFSYNKFNMNDANNRISEIINGKIQKKSKVTVIAYTDKTGSDEYNLELSKNRAESASKALISDNMETKGLGESVILYDNTLPEGRFYCRTVEVIVETEIK